MVGKLEIRGFTSLPTIFEERHLGKGALFLEKNALRAELSLFSSLFCIFKLLNSYQGIPISTTLNNNYSSTSIFVKCVFF